MLDSAGGVEAKRAEVTGSKMKYGMATILIIKRSGKVEVERKRAQKHYQYELIRKSQYCGRW
jgi:hypothetical protein